MSTIVMLFSVQWTGISVDWWDNAQPLRGCEGEPCLLRTLRDGERFYPWWDGTKVPVP